MRTTSIIAISLLMLSSTAAMAQILPGQPGYVEEGAESDTPKAKPFPLHINASTTQTLGSGTFVRGAADNPLFATNINLNPWAMWEGWIFSINQNIDVEWTQSDLTTYPNQLILSDMRLGATYVGLRFAEQNIGTIFNFALDAPLSLNSRWGGKITGITGRAGVNWTYSPAKVTFAASVGARSEIIVPGLARGACDAVVKPYEDRSGGLTTPSGCLRRDETELDNFGGGMLPRGLILSGGGNVNWVIGNGFSLGGGLTAIQLFSVYNAPDDEFTSEHARPGFGSFEFLSGWIGANYQPAPWFIASASVGHFDDLRGATRDNVRLPFLDALVFNPARNGTTYSLTTTFQY